MPDTEISSSVASDLSGAMTSYSVPSEVTDAGSGSGEFTWQMANWPRYLGYYKNIPELMTAIDAKVNWTMGAGFRTDEATALLLSTIKGHGKDSFNSIISNLVRTYTIAGDSFAEIIRDKHGMLVNIKPLDPSSIVIVHNSKGVIERYEQVSKVGGKKSSKRFNPGEILHLSRKRLSDEVHGISVIPSVEWIILARNESMSDWKRVLHRNVEPVNIFHLDTDDSTEIASFKAKMDAARGAGENMYIPKGAVEVEPGGVAPNSTLSPLQWIEQLNDYFYEAVNVPKIVIGNSKNFTDASSKIVYLAFEQNVKGEQLYIEEQVLNQLNLEINLEFPASLQNELISDNSKSPVSGAAEPNDMTAEMEGNK